MMMFFSSSSLPLLPAAKSEHNNKAGSINLFSCILFMACIAYFFKKIKLYNDGCIAYYFAIYEYLSISH
jgi:hypothetical protein